MGFEQGFTVSVAVEAPREAVWRALTDVDLSARYWGHSNVSDRQPGSRWEHVRTDGSGIADTGGVVMEATPPDRADVAKGWPAVLANLNPCWRRARRSLRSRG